MSKTFTLSQSRATGARTKKACANPLFEQWLEEWKEDAVQKNSKMQYVYAKALNSLRRYPLPLKRGKDCLILEYFGPSIAKMIDKRMQQENILVEDDGSQDLDSQEDEYKKPPKKKQKKDAGAESNSFEEEEAGPSTKQKKPTKKRAYVPSYRSGPYALLVALGLRESKPGYRGYMTKTELLADAAHHCEASMTRSESASGAYTAWNSMTTLVNKGLIIKQGHPSKYTLSPEGRELTSKLLKADYATSLPAISENADEDSDSSQNSQSNAMNNSALFHRTHLEPGQFEVVLYVDTSETTAKCKKEEVIGELRKNGVALEVVRLTVGDFVWVCREIISSGPNAKRLTISRSAEILLPYVVERKRSDDLAHSIMDGRFHEQKFRLRQTGIQAIYLHEVYGKGDYGLSEGALQQSLANTQITDGFIVQETNNIKDTCAYLTHMTRHFKKLYEGKKISSCTREEWPRYQDRGNSEQIYLMVFSDFNDFGVKAKNWTVTEMFARHLMRLRGLSVEKAYAIVQKYPTLTHLVQAYENCSSEKEKETLLSGMYFGNNARAIGPAISKAIYKLYNSSTLTY